MSTESAFVSNIQVETILASVRTRSVKCRDLSQRNRHLTLLTQFMEDSNEHIVPQRDQEEYLVDNSVHKSEY